MVERYHTRDRRFAGQSFSRPAVEVGIGARPPAPEDPVVVTLKTNPTVDALAHAIRTQHPDWEHIRQRALHEMIRGTGVYNQSQTLAGRLAEIHVSHVAYRRRDPRVVEPFPSQGKGKFSLVRKPNGVFESHQWVNGSKNQVTDYDALMICDGLPTVVEVRTSRNTDMVKEALRGETIRRKLFPLTQHLGDNLAYVVVLSPGMENQDSEAQRRFANVGGIVTSLPAHVPLDHFHERAQLILEEFKSR